MFGSRNFLFAKSAGGPAIISGKLFMWADNFAGALGTGNVIYRSSPVQVGALTTWTKLSTGNHTIATQSDGTLWTWGFANYGGLGHNNTIARSSPVQVGALTDWKTPVVGGDNISFCIKTDGTLWSWGRNQFGQIGLGDTANRSSPVQIGSSTTWTAVSAANAYNALAVDNGKLFAWGRNTNGVLGLGDTANRSSPVQVGSLTTWATPSVGGSLSLCIKTDGTLWAWGLNSSGQLGTGDTVSRS
jgi:alpha-tubulin suppressor-like RCC1 family protein